jgi:6-phosphogluconolactonase
VTLDFDMVLKFASKELLLRRAAELIVESCSGLAQPSINLTGGSTIGALYRLLATDYRAQIDWPHLIVTWGDERFVPRDHPDHNAAAARRALLDHVPVSPDHVFEIPTDLGSAVACAASYEQTLRQLGRTGDLFDVTLLSLGDDGHIASLLPGQPVLQETQAWVAAVPYGRPEQRISLTLPALARSRRLLLIASGAAKSHVLREILAGSDQYPASRLHVDGELILLADSAALGE